MTTPAAGPPRRRPRTTALVVAVVVVLVVGALVAVLAQRRAGDANANGSVPVRSTDDLAGHWTAVATTGAPAALVAPVTLEVDGDRLLVRTGCNTGQGTVRVEDSRLQVDGAGLAVTEMGCDSARTAQQEWVLEMVSARPRLERSGPYLYLHWGAGEASWLGFEREGQGEGDSS